MGHDALFTKYNQPNYKVHVAILAVIVTVSVFLAIQVSNNKENTDFAALKKPVPIDSITSQSDLPASDNEAKITVVKNTSGNDELIDPFAKDNDKPKSITLAKFSSPVLHSTAKIPVSDPATSTNLDETRSKLLIEGTVDQAVFANAGIDLAITNEAIGENKASDDDQVENKLIQQDDISVEMADQPDDETFAHANSTSNEEVSGAGENAKTISLDEVYNKQQQNFLKTLAKSQEIENQPSIDIQKIRKAIRDDKPLEVAVDAEPKSEIKSNDKVATLDKKLTDIPVKVKLPAKQAATSISNKKVVKLKKQKALPVTVTRSELNNVLSQFAYYYNSGDINRLMTLFSDNANTNDHKSKHGIRGDYDDLFKNTDVRRLMIKSIKWKLGKAQAVGAAEFEVIVQNKNSKQKNKYKGSLDITAVKGQNGIHITRLIHESQ